MWLDPVYSSAFFLFYSSYELLLKICLLFLFFGLFTTFLILSDSGYYWFNTTDFPLDEIIIEESQTAPIELENFIFVNGQYEPKITVERGKWYRWRMVMSSTQDGISKSPPPRWASDVTPLFSSFLAQ